MFQFSLLYFLIVFSLAFIFGILRTLFLLPWTGPLVAVLIEIPFVIYVSFFVAKKLLHSSALDARKVLVAGLLSFTYLMIAEYIMFLYFQSGDLQQYVLQLLTPHGFIGLLAQILFAFIPFFIVTRNGVDPSKAKGPAQ